MVVVAEMKGKGGKDVQQSKAEPSAAVAAAAVVTAAVVTAMVRSPTSTCVMVLR